MTIRDLTSQEINMLLLFVGRQIGEIDEILENRNNPVRESLVKLMGKIANPLMQPGEVDVDNRVDRV